jgi:hypothetical protein
MKKAIITLFCLSLSTSAVFAQGTTPGGMPMRDMSNPHPQKTPEQRAEAARANNGRTDVTTNILPETPVVHTAPPAPGPEPMGPPNPKAGKFKFEQTTHDYGNIPEGPPAVYDFKFKNVGKQPIVITDAHGSCGCTTATWPHDPILPKKSGVIHVTYNSAGRPGQISKDVIINSNAPQNPMMLHITGNVTPRKAE